MMVVPVIDLLGGQVVRGVAGQRASYRPIESVLCDTADPSAVAGALVQSLHFTEAYVADLDALTGHSRQTSCCRAIAHAGLRLMLDAGVRSLADVDELLAEHGPHLAGLVIASESFASRVELASIAARVGADQAVFSLDLKSGAPLTADPAWRDAPALDIVTDVVAAGFRRLIVLDLAHVGVDRGVATAGLVRRIKRAHPDVEIITGGGVRSRAALCQLDKLGASRVLIASALHDGALSPDDLRKWRS